jgi:glycosyltransferase involved in cell wall biosynthesis
MYSTHFPPQYSGAAKQAISLAKMLKRMGHHIEFLTIGRPELSRHEVVEGFHVWRIKPGRGRHTEISIWKNMFLFAYNRRRDFDVFHSHGAYYINSIVGPIAAILGWKSLVKASLAENDLFGIKGSITGMIQYFFLKMVNAYIAISRDLAAEFKQSGLPADRIHHMPNGVDTNRFKPVPPSEKYHLREVLGLPAERLIALSVGVFDHRKNIGWLMEQWVANAALHSRAFLLVIGPQSREDHQGKFYTYLKELASNNPEHLKMADPIENIEIYYQAADIFILPSKSEGMPNVVLESLSSEVPCIVTGVSGANELIQDGTTGYLFDLSRPESLERIFSRISEVDIKSMGVTGRKMIEENYSIAALAKKYDTLYHNILFS